MNIPGPQKVSPLIRIGFEEGVRRLEKALVGAGIPILFHKVIDYKTGYEKYYVLDGAAGTVKDIAARLEMRTVWAVFLIWMSLIPTDGSCRGRNLAFLSGAALSAVSPPKAVPGAANTACPS